MKVVLVRHGRAVERAHARAEDDADRPLTAEGKKRTRQVARAANRLGLVPEGAFTSPLVRARETAHIFAEEFGIPEKKIIEIRALLPSASPAAWNDEIRGRAEKCVFCIGHAPNLDRVVARLLGTKNPVTELKKAGLVVLNVRSFSRPNSEVEILLTPAVVRRLGS